MEYETLTLNLAYADGVNRNGWWVPKETLKKAVEDAHEMIETGTLSILPRYNFRRGFPETTTVDIKDVIGTVNSIDIDKLKADVKLTKDSIEEFKKYYGTDREIALFFCYLGNLKMVEMESYQIVEDLDIMYAVIMPMDLSAYRYEDKKNAEEK